MDELLLGLAFVMVKESVVVVPVVFFYLENATNKNKQRDHLDLRFLQGFLQRSCVSPEVLE